MARFLKRARRRPGADHDLPSRAGASRMNGPSAARHRRSAWHMRRRAAGPATPAVQPEGTANHRHGGMKTWTSNPPQPSATPPMEGMDANPEEMPGRAGRQPLWSAGVRLPLSSVKAAGYGAPRPTPQASQSGTQSSALQTTPPHPCLSVCIRGSTLPASDASSTAAGSRTLQAPPPTGSPAITIGPAAALSATTLRTPHSAGCTRRG